jgi:hypothetical protein
LNYKVCAGFKILEKESVTGPLASSTRRPIAACPIPRACGSSGGVVTAHHLMPARSAARHASSTHRTCGHGAVCPYPRCNGHREAPLFHLIAPRSSPRLSPVPPSPPRALPRRPAPPAMESPRRRHREHRMCSAHLSEPRARRHRHRTMLSTPFPSGRCPPPWRTTPW